MHFSRLAQRFPRKRAFITGAGSGLGLAFAKALARDGWALGLFDHNLERLTAVEGELAAAGVKVLAYPGDVTHADELTVAVNTFASTCNGLDFMINNAGVAVSGNVMDTALEHWRWIIDINLMGVVHGCRAAIPHLQRNDSGLLLNVASSASFACAPGMACYNATKAAVVALSETLASELRNSHTQVTVAMPAFFRSNLLESHRGDHNTLGTARRLMERSQLDAERVAEQILERVGAGKTYVVLPASARMLWRIKRLSPTLFLSTLALLRERIRRQLA
jgi:NADP-dependent 3-hydroxy acid dehydrogenase YdfG